MHTFFSTTPGDKSSSLLLFFNGWGMDETPLLPYLGGRCDVDYLIISVHHEDTEEIVQDALVDYDEIHLIGYSLGVAIAHKVLHGNELFYRKKGVAIAVNGTLDPISSTNGIAPEVFATMLEHLDLCSVVDFNKKMCRKEYSYYEQHLPQRSFESQKNELAYLQQTLQQVAEEDSFYDLAIIAKADMIMPAKAQNAYWQNTTTHKVAAPHFPFNQLDDLWNIVGIAQNYNIKDVNAGQK